MVAQRVDRIDRLLLALLAASLAVNLGASWLVVKAYALHSNANGKPDIAVGTLLRPIVSTAPDGGRLPEIPSQDNGG